MAQAATQPIVKAGWFRELLRDRFVWIGIATWTGFSISIPLLAAGKVPFDQPWLATVPYSLRVGLLIANPVFALTIIPLIYALTHQRHVDIGIRSPERRIAVTETLGVLVYGALILVAGQILGRKLGLHGIGLHMIGSMFGLDDAVMRREVCLWSLYNFIFYAVLPYSFFRLRHYSNEALCLTSSNLPNDLLVILYILAIGMAGDLPGNRIWGLSGHQFVVGGTLALVFSLLGTGLPIMIFLVCILVPRYMRLTGSTAATVVLSGFTYAALHLTEYWTRYDSLSHAALSVIFIVLTFGPPGMVKAYLTLRTGNAWVHLWGFHAIWPHVTDDTTTFVKIFGIR